MIYKIYIDDDTVFSYADWSILSSLEYEFTSPEEADIWCVGIKRYIDDKYLSGYKNIKYIISPATGLDHISEDVKNKYEIISLIPKDVGEIRGSSEFTVFLVLSILRKSQSIFKNKNLIIGEELYGKTIGLLGYGRIARNIRPIFEAMGAKVIFHDIAYRSGFEKQDILKLSDIIIVLVSCTKENTGYIGGADFLNIEKQPYFINMTRGFVVDDRSLLEALITKKIKGAALDVVGDINIFENYLNNNDNLIITPHLAGSTYQSYEKACNYTIQKLEEKIKSNDLKKEAQKNSSEKKKAAD